MRLHCLGVQPARPLVPAHVLILGAAGALLFAALHDVAFRTVPNWVPMAVLIDAALLRLLDHCLPAALACGVVVFALAVLCWRRGWLGGGDVKLLGATAILVPPNLVPGYIVTIALAGGGLAICYLFLERIVPALRPRRPAPLLWRILVVECRRIHRRTSLPYATAISVAAALMLMKG